MVMLGVRSESALADAKGRVASDEGRVGEAASAGGGGGGGCGSSGSGRIVTSSVLSVSRLRLDGTGDGIRANPPSESSLLDRSLSSSSAASCAVKI